MSGSPIASEDETRGFFAEVHPSSTGDEHGASSRVSSEAPTLSESLAAK